MKRIILLTLIGLMAFQTYAEDKNTIGLQSSFAKKKKKKGFDPSRLFVGGAAGGGGQQGGFAINISPVIGYSFTNNLQVGFNPGLLYFRQRIPYSNGDVITYNESYYNTSIFARYVLFNFLFVQVTPEMNFIRQKEEIYTSLLNTTTTNRNNLRTPAFLVGAGLFQPLGGNAFGMVSLSYDLVQDPNNRAYYRAPIINGGMFFGLFGGR